MTAHEDVQDRRDLGWTQGQMPFGQQQDTAVGPDCWMRRGGSELLPPQGTGVRKGSDVASFNSHSFGCNNPPPQPGPSCLTPFPAPHIIYYAVITVFKLCSAGTRRGETSLA